MSRSEVLIATNVATPFSTLRSIQPFRSNDCKNVKSFLCDERFTSYQLHNAVSIWRIAGTSWKHNPAKQRD